MSKLAENLLWIDDGHASDLALSALYDGQDELLDASVHAHVTGCGMCGERFAALAMEALDVHAGYAALVPVQAQESAAALKAFLVGLAALSFAAAWRFAGSAGEALRVLRSMPRWFPAVHKHLHGLVSFALHQYTTRGGLAASFAAAIVLVLVGGIVARSQIKAQKMAAAKAEVMS